MSTFSQFSGGGGGIKSIQRGTIAYNYPESGSKTITISAVNPAKTELRWLGGGIPDNGVQYTIIPSFVLTNSTTITVTTYGTAGGGASFSWELTEWN